MTVVPIVVFLLLSCAPTAAETLSPYGLWALSDGEARVRFEPFRAGVLRRLRIGETGNRR